MRLIDADRALEIVREQGIAHPNAHYLTNYATLILREAPTIDAVEVVRCKDCFEFETGVVGWCNHWQTGSDGMGFCSCGARMDGEAER